MSTGDFAEEADTLFPDDNYMAFAVILRLRELFPGFHFHPMGTCVCAERWHPTEAAWWESHDLERMCTPEAETPPLTPIMSVWPGGKRATLRTAS